MKLVIDIKKSTGLSNTEKQKHIR